jgi:hypothetical protein
MGECALWAQLTEPQFAAQVAAVVSLIEASANYYEATAVAKEVMAIKHGNTTGHSITKLLEAPFAGKHPKLISKGTKAAAAEAIVTAAEAVADLEEAKRLAAKFEAFGGSALTIALAQEAEPGDSLRECRLAHERLCVSETRSINYAEILTVRTDAAAEVVEVAAAEAAAADAAAAMEAAAAAGAAAEAAADALSARTAFAPKLPKEPGGGAGGIAEDAEEISDGPCLVWGPERN